MAHNHKFSARLAGKYGAGSLGFFAPELVFLGAERVFFEARNWYPFVVLMDGIRLASSSKKNPHRSFEFLVSA